MALSSILQGLGPFASPPGILVWLVILAVVLFLGRFVLALAWRLVVIAVVILTVLWILGILGFGIGVFTVTPL